MAYIRRKPLFPWSNGDPPASHPEQAANSKTQDTRLGLPVPLTPSSSEALDHEANDALDTIELEDTRLLAAEGQRHQFELRDKSSQSPRVCNLLEPTLNPRFSGWRAGVLSCSMSALGVMLVNFILLIWAMVRHGLWAGGYGILYDGNCSEARHISTFLHVLINILGTILLSASNYTMQCLNSPTRAEVDSAHSKKKWLDIGISSWRNRKFLSARNRILWWFLGLSSIPLHFLYNSAVFLDVAAQEYQATVTNATMSQVESSKSIDTLGGPFTNLSWISCLEIYNRPFVFGYGDVVFIAPADINPHAVLNHSGSSEEEGGLMNLTILYTQYISLGQTNTLTYNITYCYSETRPQHCRIKFSVPIIVVVIICNLSKAISMALAAWYAKEETLVTIGDAIASFIENPDPTTTGLCLASKEDFQNYIWTSRRTPKVYKPIREKAFYSANMKRWMTVNIFQNTPDYCIFMNLLYNGLFTCMLLGDEWNNFAYKRQPLRVTTPLGDQRSNYYLTIPYRWALPVLILSGILHWLVSESFFLVRISAYDGVQITDDSISSMGYSSLAIALSSLLLLTMLVIVNLKALQRYRPGIPLAGSCSAAIAAACHPSREETNISSVGHLQWGVVKGAGGSAGSWKNKDKDFGHCSFSGRLTAPPIPGYWYTGEILWD